MSALIASEKTWGPLDYAVLLSYMNLLHNDSVEEFSYYCNIGASSDEMIECLGGSKEELRQEIDNFLMKFYMFSVKNNYIKPRILRATMKMLRNPEMNEYQLSSLSGCSIEASEALLAFRNCVDNLF